MFIKYIKKNKNAIVGDFGCGEAKIAKSVENKVYSFDLVKNNEYITACDIAHVPLEKNCLDISVFCLSLMGTNVYDFLKEAYRVTKLHGILLIAEVVSRLESCGGAEGFKKILIRLGWDVVNMDDRNTMFVIYEAKKTNKKPEKLKIELKACKYKKQ